MAADGSALPADYVEAGISVNHAEIRDGSISQIEESVPGLHLGPSNLVWLTLDQVTEMRVDLALQLIDVARYRFRTFGREIVGVAQTEASYATGSVTITTLSPDPDGESSRPVPAGSQVSISDQLFVTTDDEAFAPGETKSIGIIAVNAGSAGSGLTATPTMQEPFSFIDTIVLDGVTTGGVDAEFADDYEDRLARRMRHQGRPILSADFSERAREIPGVARALTLDGYDAVTQTNDNEKTVTLAVVDENGVAVSTGVKDAVKALLASEREVNWNVYVIDPTYTTIDVTATITTWDGYLDSDVEDRVEQALSAFLNPGSWGATPAGQPLDNWNDEPSVMLSELYTVINNVDGVRHVPTLKIGRVQDVTAAASTDLVTLTGHGFSNDDPVSFSAITGGAPIVAGTTYYVRDVTTNTFKITATVAGAAINITTDLTAGKIHRLKTTDTALLGVASLPLAGTMNVQVA